MASPSAATAATPGPQSQPMSARTPIAPDSTGASFGLPSFNTSQNLSFPSSSLATQVPTRPQPQAFPAASTFTFIPDLYNLISRLKLLEGTPQYKLQGASSGTGSKATTLSPLLNRDHITTTKPDPDSSLPTSTPAESQLDLQAAAAAAAAARPTDDTTSIDNNKLNAALSSTTATATTTVIKSIEEDKPQALEIKDLPEHAYEIRHAIQTAKDTVTSLPDINRSIREQEVEINQLQRLIRGLQKRVNEMAVLARTDVSVDHGDQAETSTQNNGDIVMQGVEGAG